VAIGFKGVPDIRPSRDNGREHHEAERKECDTAYSTAEPEYFAISDQDDCKVLEDCVDGN